MTREKIRCQGSVTVGVIGSQALGRGLFLYPARTAEKITRLMNENRPKQGQEKGPLEVRKDLELFTHGCQGMQIAWLIDRQEGESEQPPSVVLTPSTLRHFYTVSGRIILAYGLPASYEQLQGLKFSLMPDLVRKHCFSGGS